MVSFYQVRVDGKHLQENYVKLDDACNAYSTAVDVLATAQVTGTRVEFGKVEGPPKQYTALAAATIGPDRSYTTEFCHVRLDEGEYALVEGVALTVDEEF